MEREVIAEPKELAEETRDCRLLFSHYFAFLNYDVFVAFYPQNVISYLEFELFHNFFRYGHLSVRSYFADLNDMVRHRVSPCDILKGAQLSRVGRKEGKNEIQEENLFSWRYHMTKKATITISLVPEAETTDDKEIERQIKEESSIPFLAKVEKVTVTEA